MLIARLCDSLAPVGCVRSVLWRSASPAAARALRLTAYRACPAVATSDHAPVCASFTLTLPDDAQ
jgi:hypothetical protein